MVRSTNAGLSAAMPREIRRRSAGELSNDIAKFLNRPLTPTAPSLTAPVNAAGSRSAPSSPLLTRKELLMPGTQLPHLKGGPRKGSAQRNTRVQRQSSSEVSATQTGVKEGAIEDSQTRDEDVNGTLEDALDKIKFCRYLRDSEMKLSNEETLPEELLPSSMVIGHTKVAL